jgi:hypothetical protein
MIQVIPFTRGAITGDGNTWYYDILGWFGGSGTTAEIIANVPIAADGVIRNLDMHVASAPGSGKSWTFTIRLNGADTALTCTISDLAITARFTGADVTVAVGDVICLKHTSSGTPSGAAVHGSIEFESDNVGESIYGGGGNYFTFSGGTTRYDGVFRASQVLNNTSAANASQVVAADGNITALVGWASGTPGSGEGLTAYVNLNGVRQDGTGGTVDTTLTLITVASATATFTLPVVAGDVVYLEFVMAASQGISARAIGVRFTATTDGQSQLAGYRSTLSADTSQYFAVPSQGFGSFASDVADGAPIQCGPTSFTLRDPRLLLQTAPGSGKSRTVYLRKNSGDTAVVMTVADVATTADGFGLSEDFDDTDIIAIRAFGTGTADSSTAAWTYIQGPASAVPPVPPSPGGTLPTPVDPATSNLPIGVTRLFALLTWGAGSPLSQIKVAETTFYADPSTWYGGYGYPWLLSVSPPTRELSDALRGVECTVRVADPDRVFRALATTDTLSGATIEVFLVADSVRYALGEPHRRFAGRVHSHRALPDLQYEFTLRDVLSEEMAQVADSPRIPPGRLTSTLFPGMTKDYENRAIPIAIGEVSDESSAVPQGVVPPLIVAPSLNLAAAFGGTDVDVVAAIVSHGALAPYGLWKGYYNTVDDPYTRIPIPSGAWGTILTAPGQPGWSLVGVPTDYIDYPSTPSLTHRYTPVFFLASDPNVQAVVDGRVQVAFNLYGLTENADGTGLYYADAPDIYEFLIRNWFFPPHWRYGTYNQTPTFPSGYTIVNHASVVTSRDRLRSFTGSPGGYPVGFLLGRDGQQATLRHVLTELCHGVLMEQGIDRHGRILLDVEDVDAVATHNLSDLHDIEDGEFEVWVDRGAYRNNAEFLYGRRYLPAVAPLPTPPEGETLPPVNTPANSEWSESGRYEHAAAIAANQGRASAPMQLENYVVRDPAVATDWIARNVARAVGPSPSYDGPRMFRLTTSWQALGVELGDVIAIDHIDGLGASGYVGQRARVLKITDDLQQARITLEGRVLFSAGSPA